MDRTPLRASTSDQDGGLAYDMGYIGDYKHPFVSSEEESKYGEVSCADAPYLASAGEFPFLVRH